MSTAAEARAARIKSYVATLNADLPAVPDDVKFATAALARQRKLSTVMRECGYRAINAQALAELDVELAQQQVFTDRALTSAALRRADWVSFSRLPFPPDELFFAKEAMLKDYLRAGVGNFGPFKELTLVGVEFALPSGRFIDLLCQERRRDNKGALVAIELKKAGRADGVVTQLTRYLEELARHPIASGRCVRGIIVSGRADEIQAKQLKGTQSLQVDWYVYSVKLERVGSRS